MADKKNVLLIDDEEDVRRFLSVALEDAGYIVDTATNGKEALELLKSKIPDVISLDIVMPGGSGVQFHRELRKNPAWSKIPVLIITGHARDDLGKTDFKEMTMSGPGVYLEKPVTAESYVAAIQKLTGGEISASRSPNAELRDEVKSLAETADPEKLQAILRMLKDQQGN